LARKTSETFTFLHFCALLRHFCAFIHFFERRKIVETKFNKPILPLNWGIVRLVFGVVLLAFFSPLRHQGTKEHKEILATDLHRFKNLKIEPLINTNKRVKKILGDRSQSFF